MIIITAIRMKRYTHIDVGDPPQGANHVWFRNVETGIQIQNQEGDTSSCLSRSRVGEPCSKSTEARLHSQSGDENNKEEDSITEP